MKQERASNLTEASSGPGERRLNSLMREVVSGLQDNNVDTGKLLGEVSSAVGRMNFLTVIATFALIGLGVQLFVGITSRELAMEANRQRALDMVARAQLQEELRHANESVSLLLEKIQHIEEDLAEAPKVMRGRRGAVVLSVPVDKDTKAPGNRKAGGTVQFPLNMFKTR